VYPGGVMYSQVQKSDVKKIIESHLLDSNAEKYIQNDKSISDLIYWVTGKKL
jgi:(2Fe-2S) ferredoxin